MSWPTVIIVIGLFAGLGPIIDRFILNRHKGQLYHLLLECWDKLDETSIPHLPKLMAALTLRGANKIIGIKLFSLKSVLRIGAISASLTLMGVILPMTVLIHFDLDGLFSIDTALLFCFLILINFPFDFITTWVSYKMLQIVKSNTIIVGLLAIAVDIIVAIMLAVASATTLIILSEETNATTLAIERVWKAVSVLFGLSAVEYVDDWEYTSGFLGSTTLIPTLIYIGILIVCSVAKPIAEIGRGSAMYLLERATEDEPNKLIVFTLLGSLASALILLVKTILFFSTTT